VKDKDFQRKNRRAQKQARAKTATDDDAAATTVSESDDSEPDYLDELDKQEAALDEQN
jgi:hypothetical protein